MKRLFHRISMMLWVWTPWVDFGGGALQWGIPNPGEGTRVMAWVQSDQDQIRLDRELKQAFGEGLGRSPVRSQVIATLKGKAELEFQKQSPLGARILDLSAYFPKTVSDRFNRSAGFSGPNCFFTALSLSGLLPASEVRYISPEEFEWYLKYHYQRIEKPSETGDLILFDASRSRGHVVTVLFQDFVFHKKSYPKGYLYRMTRLDRVFEKEPGEWEPRPGSDFSLWVPSQSAQNDREFYRLKGPIRFRPEAAITEKEQNAILWIEAIKAAVIRSAPQWKVGSTMGILSERLTADLLQELRFLKMSPNLIAQLRYAELISLHDQIFQSIDEQYFSTPYSSSRRDRIFSENCFSDNEYLSEMIRLGLRYSGRSESKAGDVLNRLQKEDRIRCDRISLVKMLSES